MKTFAAVAAALGLFLTAEARAQAPEFPTRLVKIVVPFPAGGATDIMARNIAQKLFRDWFVFDWFPVENEAVVAQFERVPRQSYDSLDETFAVMR